MTLPNQANLDKIHAASIRILAETGVRLHSPRAGELFAREGQMTSGDLVYPAEDFIFKTLASAPANFTLEARDPRYNMSLGGGPGRHYAAGYGCPAIIEADGARRPALLSDYGRLAKMVHRSPWFKINGGILVQPNDVPPPLASLVMVYSTLVHSDKCLFSVPGLEPDIRRLMALAASAWGGLREFSKAPRSLTMISTLSPLQIDRLALDSILVCAELGQAMMISPGPMAGATGPVTLAGNIALGNAECLTGLTLAQLVRPGTPVMYGLQATTSDLRTGAIAIGTPGYPLQAAYCKALADYYRLPCRCGGGVNDAKEVSAQSGYEAVLPIFTAAQNGVDLIVHAAGILDSWAAFSFEKFICDLDIISMTEYFLNDIVIDEESLAVDLINAVGPGGIFLNQKHTLKLARSEPWYPKVAQRGSLGGRRAADHLLDNARREMEQLLASYQAPPLPREMETEMDRLMVAAGADQARLAAIKPR